MRGRVSEKEAEIGRRMKMKTRGQLSRRHLSSCRGMFTAFVLFCVLGNVHGQQFTIARLAGGLTSREGRVEIFHDGQWGTICDDGFGLNEAAVICRMVGHAGPARRALLEPYGPGTGVIWLDSIQCLGNEANIDECSSNGWGQADCTHSEDAAVICVTDEQVVTTFRPPVTDPPSITTTGPPRICENPSTNIRLLGGRNDAEGRVEILYNGAWGSVCDDGWGVEDARVVCRMLCYNPVNAVALGTDTTRDFGLTNSSYIMNNVQCNGGEFLLQNCPFPGYGVGVGACRVEEAAAVRCFTESQSTTTVPEPVVECDEDNIIVRFDKNKEPLLRTDFIDLLTDPIPNNCQYTERNEPTSIVAVIPFVNCNTNRQLNATHITYSNTIVHSIPSTNPVITRNTQYLIDVSCVISRNTNPSNPNIAPQSNVAPPVNGDGEFDVDMAMFVNNNFEQSVPSYPVPVTLGDWVYVGVTLKSKDKDLKLVVPECYGTPTNDPNFLQYKFIENKCRIETTVTFYPMNQTVFGFRFQSFKFLENQPYVYVHCLAYICTVSETGEECDRSCRVTNARKKRGIGDNEIDEHDEDLRGIVELDRGPLVIMDDVRWLEETNLDGHAQLSETEVEEVSGSSRPDFTRLLWIYLVLLLCILVLY